MSLEKLANEVDAPGNDVFDNGDVTTEAQRMEAALTRFNQALSESRREIAKEPPSEARPMLTEIHEIDGLMQAMVADGGLIFRALLQGQRNEAAARMARMDRGRATLQQKLIRADDLIRRFQANEFRQQQQYVGTLWLYGYYVVALIVLSIIALALYARRLLRELLVVDQREQYLRKLEAREEELRKSEERFHLAVWSNAIHPDDLQRITRDTRRSPSQGRHDHRGRLRRGDPLQRNAETPRARQKAVCGAGERRQGRYRDLPVRAPPEELPRRGQRGENVCARAERRARKMTSPTADWKRDVQC